MFCLEVSEAECLVSDTHKYQSGNDVMVHVLQLDTTSAK